MDRTPLKTDVSVEASIPPQKPMPTTNSLSHMDNIEFQRFADLFEVGYEDRKDTNLYDKLNHLYEWGKENTGADDRIKIYTALKQVTRGMGWTEKGHTQIKKLYKWTRLDQTRRKAEAEQEAMSG